MFGSPCSGVFQEPKSREHNLAPSTADTRKKPRPTAHNHGRGSITMHPQGQIQPDTAPNSTQPTLRAHNLAPSTADTGKKPRPTAHNHGRGSTNLHPQGQIQPETAPTRHTTDPEGTQSCTLDHRYITAFAPTSQCTQKPRERKRGAHGASVIREPTAGDQSWKPL